MPNIELKKVKHLLETLPTYKRYILLTMVGAIFVFLSIYIYKTYFSSRKGASMIEGYANAMDLRNSNDEKGATLYFFKTDWCPHCKNAKPIWDSFAKENQDKTFNGYRVQFVTIDCDQDPSTADKFGVNSYPTIKLDNRGEVIEFQGKPEKAALEQFLNSALH